MKNSCYDNLGLVSRALLYGYKRFYKNFYHLFDDLMASGYVEILSHYSSIEDAKTEKEKFSKCLQWALFGFNKLVQSEIRNSYNSYSLSLMSEDFDEELFNTYFIDYCSLEYGESSFLFEELSKMLSTYPKKQKYILNCYFFIGYSVAEISKMFHISRACIVDLILDFRQNLFNSLLNCGFFKEKDKFLLTYNEFEKKEKLPDIKICSLLKENKINIEDISKIVQLDVKKVKDVLEHKRNNCKFYLWQIQKLRKVYFPEFTLEELVI